MLINYITISSWIIKPIVGFFAETVYREEMLFMWPLQLVKMEILGISFPISTIVYRDSTVLLKRG